MMCSVLRSSSHSRPRRAYEDAMRYEKNTSGSITKEAQQHTTPQHTKTPHPTPQYRILCNAIQYNTPHGNKTLHCITMSSSSSRFSSRSRSRWAYFH